MLALKYFVALLAGGFFISATGIVIYDIYAARQLRLLLTRATEGTAGASQTALFRFRPFGPVGWRLAPQPRR